ncbi:MAG: AAA family ATPase [Dehalococcoidales bacterium]|nr:AAA family ATPase [Dehalococcoidales bacterium]
MTGPVYYFILIVLMMKSDLFTPQGILFINGMSGAGKTTAADLVARSYPRSALIKGDEIHNLMVAGRIHPPGKPEDEVQDQLWLRDRNMALLADSFFESGIFPVLEQCISTRRYLDYLFSRIKSRPVAMVVLAPPVEVALERDRQRIEKNVAHLYIDNYFEMKKELSGIGLWLDTKEMTPDQTAEAIVREAFSKGIVYS